MHIEVDTDVWNLINSFAVVKNPNPPFGNRFTTIYGIDARDLTPEPNPYLRKANVSSHDATCGKYDVLFGHETTHGLSDTIQVITTSCLVLLIIWCFKRFTHDKSSQARGVATMESTTQMKDDSTSNSSDNPFWRAELKRQSDFLAELKREKDVLSSLSDDSTPEPTTATAIVSETTTTTTIVSETTTTTTTPVVPEATTASQHPVKMVESKSTPVVSEPTTAPPVVSETPTTTTDRALKQAPVITPTTTTELARLQKRAPVGSGAVSLGPPVGVFSNRCGIVRTSETTGLQAPHRKNSSDNPTYRAELKRQKEFLSSLQSEKQNSTVVSEKM
jgi:hypothetical protein